MSIKTIDRLVHPPRRPLEDVLTYFDAHPPKRRDEAEACANETYRLCAQYELDPCICIARQGDETGNTTGPEAIYVSDIWNERLNCGGLGVTDGGDEMIAFADGTASARAFVAHMVAYSTQEWEMGELTPADDPRWEAVVEAGWNDTCYTLADLEGKWFTNPQGAENSAKRGNDVYPSIPDQMGTGAGVTGETDFPFDQAMTTRDLGKLDTRTCWITIHNNGNPSSDPYDEAGFVQGGGGDGGVLYHAAIGASVVVQIAKLDQEGVHAGNYEGNHTSVAFEMCVGEEPWDRVKEYAAQFMAEIVTNSRGILDYGGFGPECFSLDRVREHRDWPGANPACPARCIAEDGSADDIIARAKEIVAQITQPAEPEPIYPTKRIPAPDVIRAQGFSLAVNAPNRFRCIQGTTLRTYPNREAPAGTPTPAKAGKTYTFDWRTEVEGETWYVSKAGSWALAHAFEMA